MQIVEVNNNLIKVNYNTAQESLILSGFIVIKDFNQSFIGQIIHLEASAMGNFAVVKLLFNFDSNGIITNYNGSIPSTQSLLDIVLPQELLELLPVKTPVIIGELAQQNTLLKLDASAFDKNLLICSEKKEHNEILIKNIISQLYEAGKKLLIFDLNNSFDVSTNKVIASKTFKLPLNYDSINFVYREIDNASAETKALIQEIFLEVQNYVKSLPEGYIPFESFKDVVDKQYEESDIVELILLKNKLLKYYESGIFAQDKNEFDTLRRSLAGAEPTVFNLSEVDEKIQREMISYALNLVESMGKDFYVILNINDNNSDKKLLKQVFMTKNVHPITVCPYSYKYLKELKQVSKDLILFAPIQQQNDFAGYSTFLNKLNPQEFIIYGQSTHHLPFIVRLDELSKLLEKSSPQPVSQQDLLDEQIKKDLEKMYTTPKSEATAKEPEQAVSAEGNLTEDDLDLIENLGIATENITQEEESDEELTIIENEPQNEIEPEIQEISEETVFENPQEFQSVEMVTEETPESFEEEISMQEAAEEIEIRPIESIEPAVKEETLAEQMPQAVQMQPQTNLEPPEVDILPADISNTPIVPIYPADIEPQVQSDTFEQGDEVTHPKYGKGVVEKMISYGSKNLCSINFDNVGRRLLDPTLAEIKKL